MAGTPDSSSHALATENRLLLQTRGRLCPQLATSPPSCPSGQFRAVRVQPPASGYTLEPLLHLRLPPAGQHLPHPAARPGPTPLARTAAGGSRQGERKGGREEGRAAGPAMGWAMGRPPPSAPAPPVPAPHARLQEPATASLGVPLTGSSARRPGSGHLSAPALPAPRRSFPRRPQPPPPGAAPPPVFFPLQPLRSLPPPSPPSLLPLGAAASSGSTKPCSPTHGHQDYPTSPPSLFGTPGSCHRRPQSHLPPCVFSALPALSFVGAQSPPPSPPSWPASYSTLLKPACGHIHLPSPTSAEGASSVKSID